MKQQLANNNPLSGNNIERTQNQISLNESHISGSILKVHCLKPSRIIQVLLYLKLLYDSLLPRPCQIIIKLCPAVLSCTPCPIFSVVKQLAKWRVLYSLV
jgi:hypothetical protein